MSMESGNWMKCIFQVSLKELNIIVYLWKKVTLKNVPKKIKINLTQEWKDYLQSMEFKPVETASSDKFLILWCIGELN